MKIFIAQINPKIGDLAHNTDKILHQIDLARAENADIVLFSESVISGYPAEDLLLFEDFISEMDAQLSRVIEASKDLFIAIGTIRKNPNKDQKPLFNSVAVIIDGKLQGYKDKSLLPTYDVFDERRYFEPGREQKVFEYKNKKIAITICEDVWQHAKEISNTNYSIDPVLDIQKLNPDILLNLSASPYYFRKKDIRFDIFSKVAKTLKCPVIMCNQVGANDQLVFDGYSMCFNEKGDILSELKGFVEDHQFIDLEKPFDVFEISKDPIKDLYNALVLGVKDYFRKQNLSKACIGLSGGIDSALVLCIAVDALGSHNILCVNMPSRFSSLSSMEDSHAIVDNLKVELLDIPIDHIFQEYLNLLSPIFAGKAFDTTEENLQARIRGMVLMAISNKLGHIVLSTGNKSEMAVGYSTLYGDMCGGLGVLIDTPKTLVYELCKWINRKKDIIPLSIITKEPSAELRENQKDTDTLPDYKIVDQILQGYVEDHLSLDQIVEKYKIKKEVVSDLIARIHKAEYKRRQSPPGIRVTKKSFTKGRVFPIVQLWK